LNVVFDSYEVVGPMFFYMLTSIIFIDSFGLGVNN